MYQPKQKHCDKLAVMHLRVQQFYFPFTCVQTRQAEEAFLKILSLDSPQNRSLHSYRMMGHMRQCMGQHTKAVDILTKAMNNMTGPFQRMEITFLRGA